MGSDFIHRRGVLRIPRQLEETINKNLLADFLAIQNIAILEEYTNLRTASRYFLCFADCFEPVEVTEATPVYVLRYNENNNCFTVEKCPI